MVILQHLVYPVGKRIDLFLAEFIPDIYSMQDFMQKGDDFPIGVHALHEFDDAVLFIVGAGAARIIYGEVFHEYYLIVLAAYLELSWDSHS
jgi:hypothetical protein